MKNLFWVFALMVSMLTTSCSSTLTDEMELSSQTANLTFTVKSDVFQSSFSRATASEVLKQLDLALYTVKDGVYTKYASVESSSTSAGFGKLSLSNVAYGTYTLLAVGNASDYGGHAVMSDIHQISFQSSPVPACYYVCQQVTIDESSEEIPLELKPACSSFRISMNGKVPQNTAKIKFSIKNASTYLDATTGLAPAAKIQDFDAEVVVPPSALGKIGQTARVNFFLSRADLSSESGISITVVALDTDNQELASYDFQDVGLKSGFVTTYTGNFFQAENQGFSISVDKSWGDLTGTF